MQTQQKYYQTKDLAEAASLISAGAKLERMEEGGAFQWFIFNSLEVSVMAQQFWSGELMVSALTYSNNLRMLKDRIFSRR